VDGLWLARPSVVLLLTDEEFETWTTGTTDEACAILKEYPPDQMRMVQSGFEKGDMLKA
jgi:putative SOS response-associated peptidase YedK